MADHISLALANIKLRESLREKSVRDPLTGVFNRRYMEEALERELPRALRSQQALSLVIIDIDHFKRFNDLYGHEAGDLVLTRLSRLLQILAHDNDVVCRLGGEEFALIIPGVGSAEGILRAEDIRRAVADMKIEYAGQPIGPVTISLGVAAFPEHSTNETTLLRQADQALYRAKENGRNRVEAAGL